MTPNRKREEELNPPRFVAARQGFEVATEHHYYLSVKFAIDPM